ncbi:MAG TPA: CsbD family protein [Armatimonadota bacterium]
MNKERVEGAYDQAKGEVKQEIGNATGDADLHDEGTWDKVKGAVKEGAGKVKDALRDN